MQLKNPQLMAPPFKFGTVPYGSTETNLMTHYPSIYGYMRKYSKANAIEGVKAVKDGSVLLLLFSLQYPMNGLQKYFFGAVM